MIEGLSIRQANKNDIDFVIEAIFESEKSGSQVITSCNIFGVDEKRFKEILQILLIQDIEYYDYYLSGFHIAERNGEYIGALGSWFEGGSETPSGIIKATVLFQHLDKSKIIEINKNYRTIKGLILPKEMKTLQLEHGYTREPYRRQGVFQNLLRTSIKNNLSKYSFNKVQGIIFKDNYKSLNAHLKFGYSIIEEKKVDDPEILKYFPYNSKLLIEFGGEKLLNI